MQSNKFFILLLTLLLWQALSPCHAASDSFRGREYLKSVSMIELISNPEKFDGKRVIVSGFVHFEFEGNGLYLHEEDFVDGLRSNGIGLGVTPEQEKQYADCDSKYCFIVGTFHAVPPHHFSLWSGGLSNITAMQILATSANKSGSIPNKPASSKSYSSAQSTSNALLCDYLIEYFC